MSKPESATTTRGRAVWVRRVLVTATTIVLAVLVWTQVAEPLRVGSDSMSPTLHTGQPVLLDKLTYRFRVPHAGEVVAFRASSNDQLTVKRVAASAGDRLEIRDGWLWVNERRVHEGYLDHRTVDSVYFGPITVPGGHVFVLGDNRAASIDSRTYGPVPLDDVLGRVLFLS